MEKIEDGHFSEFNFSAQAASFTYFHKVTEQSKACNIRHRIDIRQFPQLSPKFV